jgi:hypothetical protein
MREFLVDDVVENDAAPAMRGLIELLARPKRSDDHRHLVLLAQCQIKLEPVVRSVHDLVDRKRRRRPFGMRLVVGRELLLDPPQPFVQQLGRPRVQRRKTSDHARLALRDHEIGHRNDEQRRTDHGNGQTALEQGRHRHGRKFLLLIPGYGMRLLRMPDIIPRKQSRRGPVMKFWRGARQARPDKSRPRRIR